MAELAHRSPHRVKRLLEAFEFRKQDKETDGWVRLSLRELADEGDTQAEEALQNLPLTLEKK